MLLMDSLLCSVCIKKARRLSDALCRIGSPPAPCIATPGHCLGVISYVLRSLYPMTRMSVPSRIESPALTLISVMVPSHSALMPFSIFIASSTATC